MTTKLHNSYFNEYLTHRHTDSSKRLALTNTHTHTHLINDRHEKTVSHIVSLNLSANSLRVCVWVYRWTINNNNHFFTSVTLGFEKKKSHALTP